MTQDTQTPQQPQWQWDEATAVFAEKEMGGNRYNAVTTDDVLRVLNAFEDLRAARYAEVERKIAAQAAADELAANVTHLEGALREAEQQRESFRELVLKWGDGGTVEKENDERRFALAREVDELQTKLREAEAKTETMNQARIDASEWAMRVEHEKADVEYALIEAEAKAADEYRTLMEQVLVDCLPIRDGLHECVFCHAKTWNRSNPRDEHQGGCVAIEIIDALQQPKAGA